MHKRPLATTLSILVLWIAFYASFTLFTPALLDDADSVHAEVAREMLARHDWVTLYANGIRYLEKAPLLYWAMAASMRVAQLLGHASANALAVAARIPLALTVLALAFTVESFARSAFRSARAGLYAALLLLSSFGVFLFTRITLPDALLCLWLTLALYAFWLTEDPEQQDNPSLAPAFLWAACCALGVLTKGLIGLVFPAAIVVLYLCAMRGWRGFLARVRQMRPIALGAVFLVIAAPWHFLAAIANPTQGYPEGLTRVNGHFFVPMPTQGNVHGWAWFYFVNEQVLRYLNLRVPRDYDTVPLWLFWGLCLIWLMPWSAFLFKALGPAAQFLRIAFTDLRERQPDRLRRRFRFLYSHPVSRAFVLLTVWALVPLLFFSFSTRQEYYVLPSLPPLILLLAGWLTIDSRVQWQPVTRGARLVRRANLRATAVLAGLGAAFAVAAVVIFIRAHAPAPNTDLASLLRQNPGDYALSMGHFLDLNAQALGLFRLPLALAAVSLLVGPLASYQLRKQARPHVATLALAAGAFGFLLAAHLGLRTFAPVLSSAQLAEAIAPQVHPDDLVVIHQEYEYGSTLGFYLQRPAYLRAYLGDIPPVAVNPVHILEGRSSNLWYGSFFSDAPDLFETPLTLKEKWAGPQRIFLWQDLANQPSPLPAQLSPVYVLARSGGKEIVSNQPNRP